MSTSYWALGSVMESEINESFCSCMLGIVSEMNPIEQGVGGGGVLR